MTDEPPAHLIDWQRRRLDARHRGRTGRAPERALHRARAAVPVDRPRVGGPAGRADRRDPVRRPPRDDRAAGVPRRSTGSTASSSASTMGSRDDRRGGGHGRRAAPRPVRDAAVLRLQHGRLLRPLAEDRRTAEPPSCRGSSTSTGSARTRTAVPVAGLRREQPRARVDRRALRGHGGGDRDPDRQGPRRRASSTATASTSTPGKTSTLC